MERQAILLAETRARFGGRSSRWPWVMVAPRRLAQPSRSAIQRLAALGVEVVVPDRSSELPWFPIFNKVIAIETVEALARQQFLWFLDTDTLVTGDLSTMDIPPDCDFLANHPQMSGASLAGGGPNHAYWTHAGRVLQFPVDRLPVVRSLDTGQPIYQYWNNGVFLVRRGAGFGATYREDFKKLFFSGAKSPVAGLYHTSQVTLPFTLARLGLRTGVLPLRFHHQMSHLVEHDYLRQVQDPAVIHYFGSLWPDYFNRFVERLMALSPAAGAMVAEHGPLNVPGGLGRRALRKVVTKVYGLSLKRHLARQKAVSSDSPVAVPPSRPDARLQAEPTKQQQVDNTGARA